VSIQRAVRIADETKSVCRLTAKRVFPDGSEIGSAVSSGFLWRHNGNVYVVTNWHCLTGKNAKTLLPLGNFFPNRVLVECKFNRPDKQDAKLGTLLSLKHEVPIEDDTGNRLWIEHPMGHTIDIAAFRLPIVENGGHHFCCLNEIDYEGRWQPVVATDAFIVGFPEGVASAHETPIWKRASIASEPDLNYDESPVFLVDTIGNRGVSGSPVVAVGSGMFLPDAELSGDSVIGSWKRFVGVYAGRLGEDGIWAQLGRVWKASLIDELFGT
jgi:hypothetical protein